MYLSSMLSRVLTIRLFMCVAFSCGVDGLFGMLLQAEDVLLKNSRYLVSKGIHSFF